jgi:antirestriction protein ArdC
LSANKRRKADTIIDAINHITREPYSGKNQLILSAYAAVNGYAPEFVTFKQALSIGRCVRRGEHGCHIVKIVEGKEDANGRRRKGPRGYTVFAIAQTDALPIEGAA